MTVNGATEKCREFFGSANAVARKSTVKSTTPKTANGRPAIIRNGRLRSTRERSTNRQYEPTA